VSRAGIEGISDGSDEAEAEDASTQTKQSTPAPVQTAWSSRESENGTGHRAHTDPSAGSSVHIRTSSPAVSASQDSPDPDPPHCDVPVNPQQPRPSDEPSVMVAHGASDQATIAAVVQHTVFSPPSILSLMKAPIPAQSRPKSKEVDTTDEPSEIKKQESGIKAETIDLTSEPEVTVIKTERKPHTIKRKTSASKPVEVDEDDEEDLRLELRKIDIQQRLKKMLKQRERQEVLNREI